ncbi:secondary thiamine-phosphate synthase enzyme YjbQ [Pelagovum pacificum]|uniref:YjbQ family protein n=1 Tax=Pelagovum pacificum TaxID=2588711 RepID=A0A5C5G9Z5_9RHOB|nr:secondary thiamine-phosphate synthase enzyme YjbQ [Pelagovum pacificum]QQA41548.1 YjbQ family protein [Pelagovum pacificum]TNY30828.1 YjbQ family protein [Pelagovum pacificum]
MQTILSIPTRGPGLTDFTREVAAWVQEQRLPGDALLTLFVQHTSCSLLIQENADPDVQSDLLAWLKRFVPNSDAPEMSYLTHTAEGPDDMPAHIKASVLPVSLQIPVLDGRLQLGTWQGIYLFEHRRRPHHRQVVLHLA